MRIHPFTVISGCYELANELVRDTGSELIIVRPPFNDSSIAMTDEEEVRKMVWNAFNKAYPYDICGDNYCDYVFVVNNLDAVKIMPEKYTCTYTLSNMNMYILKFRLV